MIHVSDLKETRIEKPTKENTQEALKQGKKREQTVKRRGEEQCKTKAKSIILTNSRLE